MARNSVPRYAGLLAVLFLDRVAGSAVTPVQKVVDLLKNLQQKVEADGKKEATQYDNYACFCKEQLDEKSYAIEKSDKKIDSLTAKIDDLDSDLATLSTDISNLGKSIGDLKTDIETATSARKTEHDAYLEKEADTSGAIDAMERAIETLKSSKSALKGKVNSEALMQLRAVAGSALGATSHASGVALSESQLRFVSSLRKGNKPGAAYEFQYHSNDIIAMLEGLRLTFKSKKEELDTEEFQANAAFEKKRLSMENEKKFLEEEKAEKEKLEAMKTEHKEEAEKTKTLEDNDRTADKDFLKVLTTNCEEKAAAWDERSKTRTAELTALSEAMEALETGVAPNWKANRKLVGLQRKMTTGVVAKRPASFLQLRGSERQAHRASQVEALQQKVLRLLSSAADSLSSPALSVAVLKVKVHSSGDHFVKVRSIIKDIITKLEDQATAEATTKGLCDTQMAEAVKTRDSKKEEIEGLSATISSKLAQKAQLKTEIAALSEAIAANEKALKEATELREEEKLDNEKVVDEAKAGKEAVEYALQVLKEFYDGQSALVQKRSAYVPPDSDRSGKTVADLAPEAFEDPYKGRQEASKGIIGLLEVILSDFENTGTTVQSNEDVSAGEFTTFEGQTNDDTSAKQTAKTGKEDEVTGIDDELVTLEDDKKSAEEDLAGALSELEKLHSMCVAGEETYEERVAKREKEIAALKEAHDILENWQG